MENVIKWSEEGNHENFNLETQMCQTKAKMRKSNVPSKVRFLISEKVQY